MPTDWNQEISGVDTSSNLDSPRLLSSSQEGPPDAVTSVTSMEDSLLANQLSGGCYFRRMLLARGIRFFAMLVFHLFDITAKAFQLINGSFELQHRVDTFQKLNFVNRFTEKIVGP